MKTKRKGINPIIRDNLYVLKLIKEASPNFILLTLFTSLLVIVDTISNTWLSKTVFDGMTQGTPYITIVVSVLVLLGLMLFSAIMRTVFYHKITPVASEKIRCYIRSLIYGKTKSMDLNCFEDPFFYDKYTRALAEADERAYRVLSSLSNLSSSIISLATLLSIIVILDPILITLVP